MTFDIHVHIFIYIYINLIRPSQLYNILILDMSSMISRSRCQTHTRIKFRKTGSIYELDLLWNLNLDLDMTELVSRARVVYSCDGQIRLIYIYI